MSSQSKFEEALKKFRNLVKEKAIRKYITGEKNHNVSGDFIYNCKNVKKSYYIHDGENEKYAIRGGKGQKDTYDGFGIHAGELSYECNNIDFSSMALFCVNGENHLNTRYLLDCHNIENAIGCIGVRKKKYCILNKEYGEQEFDNLKNKILKHMDEMPYTDARGRMYKYGEFFPVELSPHSYNETLAQEYVPISEEDAVNLGYPWLKEKEKEHSTPKSWKDLPENIEDAEDSILKETILCQAWDEDSKKAREHKCTKGFRVIPNELSTYKRFGLPLPRKCPNTRNFENSQLRNAVEFYERQCSCDYKVRENSKTHNHHKEGQCPNKFETCYSPERKNIIYCEPCYQAEVA